MRSFISALILSSIVAAAWWARVESQNGNTFHSSKSTPRNALLTAPRSPITQLASDDAGRSYSPILPPTGKSSDVTWQPHPSWSFNESLRQLEISTLGPGDLTSTLESIVENSPTEQLLNWTANPETEAFNLPTAETIGRELRQRGTSLELLKEVGPGPFRAAIVSPTLQQVANEDPAKAAEFLNAQTSHEDLRETVAIVAQNFARQDLTTALEWIATIECDSSAEHALNNLQLLKE